jgi:uncharacterized phage protein (TIGR01671 family)
MTALYFDGVTAVACDVKFNITTTDGQRNDNLWEDSGSDDIVLMQFTGLKDKNGKDVFEGDVVSCSSLRGNDCLHAVVWEEPKIMTHMGSWNLSGMSAGYDWIGQEEVRGNIYENPELLQANHQEDEN